MIDIHSHLLYGLDDGAQTVEETMAMIRLASASFTKELVFTPHIAEEFKFTLDTAVQRFKEVRKRTADENIDIKLHLGFEVRLDKEIIASHEFYINRLTVNNAGKYILLEFPFLDIPAYYKEIIKYLTSADITPIIVHPLRNSRIIQNPSIIKELCSLGCLMQFNTDDTRDPRSSSILLRMLKQGHAHFIASDSHSIDLRPPILLNAYRFIEKRAGKKSAEMLFVENPKRMVEGEIIDEEDLQKQGFFDRIKDIFNR
ncbi:MAG: tyrosine-protein phosphatase [bacterium]